MAIKSGYLNYHSLPAGLNQPDCFVALYLHDFMGYAATTMIGRVDNCKNEQVFTTVELLCSEGGHRTALQAAGVLASGGGLGIARLSILLQ